MPCSGFDQPLAYSGFAGVAAHLAGAGLKPRLVDTFKISTDPAFEEKLTDVVGLYLILFSPPGEGAETHF